MGPGSFFYIELSVLTVKDRSEIQLYSAIEYEINLENM